MPRPAAASRPVAAQRIARAGPSKVARIRPPVFLMTCPRWTWMCRGHRGGPAAVVRRGRAQRVDAQDRREQAVGLGRVAGPGRAFRLGEEPLDLGDHGIGVTDPEEMVAGLLEVARPGDVAGQVAAVEGRGDAVAGTLDDQGRDVDGRQHVPDVDRPAHPDDAQQGAGAHRHPLPAGEFLPRPRRACAARRVPLDALALPPAVRREALEGLDHLAGLVSARVVGRRHPAGGRCGEHQRAHPLGVGGGEQQAHRAALRVAEQHSPARPAGAHHRLHVGHALFERQVAGSTVGQAGVPLVEHDQPAQPGQPPEEPRRGPVLPPPARARPRCRAGLRRAPGRRCGCRRCRHSGSPAEPSRRWPPGGGPGSRGRGPAARSALQGRGALGPARCRAGR